MAGREGGGERWREEKEREKNGREEKEREKDGRKKIVRGKVKIRAGAEGERNMEMQG